MIGYGKSFPTMYDGWGKSKIEPHSSPVGNVAGAHFSTFSSPSSSHFFEKQNFETPPTDPAPHARKDRGKVPFTRNGEKLGALFWLLYMNPFFIYWLSSEAGPLVFPSTKSFPILFVLKMARHG